MSAFGKMALLLTSKAKQAYAGEICVAITKILDSNQTKLKTELGSAPKGFILVTDIHASKSDNKPHYTVDAYDVDKAGADKPIGCIHVYPDGNVQTYTNPRKKAEDAYKKIVGSS